MDDMMPQGMDTFLILPVLLSHTTVQDNTWQGQGLHSDAALLLTSCVIHNKWWAALH
jgi:hypothetical protein